MTRDADAPRSRRIIRLIALERGVRGVLLVAAGIYLFTHLGTDFGRLADHIMRAIELNPQRPFLHRVVVYLHDLHASEIKVAAAGAIIYGAIELVEGTGLWFDKLWAEFLTVISTSLLLPYELYELSKHVTWWKVLGTAINIAIVIYLVIALRRRLRTEKE